VRLSGWKLAALSSLALVALQVVPAPGLDCDGSWFAGYEEKYSPTVAVAFFLPAIVYIADAIGTRLKPSW
jgi:hypothetical protein